MPCEAIASSETGARLLVIVAASHDQGRRWAMRHGADALRVRVVVKADQLRGWKPGTLVAIADWHAIDPRVRQELGPVLDVMFESGRMVLAGPERIDALAQEALS